MFGFSHFVLIELDIMCRVGCIVVNPWTCISQSVRYVPMASAYPNKMRLVSGRRFRVLPVYCTNSCERPPPCMFGASHTLAASHRRQPHLHICVDKIQFLATGGWIASLSVCLIALMYKYRVVYKPASPLSVCLSISLSVCSRINYTRNGHLKPRFTLA